MCTVPQPPGVYTIAVNKYIIDPEDGGSKTLRNVANLSVRHGVISETLNFIQTAVKTSSRTFFV